MDNSQILLSKLLETVPECISSRQKLKATLMDIMPTEKRAVNLLLGAYDENIIVKLRNPIDPTLYAFREIKTLSEEYGMTQDAAKWAITTWCYILGKDEIANALDVITVCDESKNNAREVCNTHEIGIGAFKAGFDFKAGDISLKHLTNGKQAPGKIKGVTVLCGGTIDCYVNTTSARKGAEQICSFTDSCHLEIDEGKYLIITTSCDWAERDMIKIELTEYNSK